VRNIRDTNWLEDASTKWFDGLLHGGPVTDCGVEYNGNSCIPANADKPLNIDTNGFYGYPIGTPTLFKRKIHIVMSDASTIQVTVTVSWKERGREQKFVAREDLKNWLGGLR